MDAADEIAGKVVAGQAAAMSAWALGTAILMEVASHDPEPDACLSRLFERANMLLDHMSRDGETQMLGLARASVEGSFEWARRSLEPGG